MTLERRANLLFLAGFLILSLPGLVLLLRKKADATIRPMGSPENVRPHLVFIDPVDAPAQIPRMAPALTMAWVRDLARERFGSTRTLARRDEHGRQVPVMSDRRLAQLVDARDEGGKTRYAVIVWNLPRGAVEARLGSPGGESASALIDLPAAVKQDLQLSGLPAPPQKILWGEIALNSAESRKGFSIDVAVDGRMIADQFSELPVGGH